MNAISIRQAAHSGAVLEIFIWVGQSKANQILGKPTSGVRGDHGDDPRRLGRPGTSLSRPWLVDWSLTALSTQNTRPNS